MTIADLPAINASLNGVATVLIIAGLLCIKAGKKKAHGGIMIAALVVSAAFLTCYVIHKMHYQSLGSTHMGGFRPVYLTILISHIILAIVNLPMIIITVVAAIRGKFEAHKRWARRTFPIWLYVSVTGVLVYFMIYVWFPVPTAA